MKDENNSLTPIKDIINAILKEDILPINPDDARIWDIWDKEVEPAYAMYARPLWIKQGTLKVSVKHPIVIQELGFMERDIRDRLNKKMGRDAIKKIEFTLTSE